MTAPESAEPLLCSSCGEWPHQIWNGVGLTIGCPNDECDGVTEDYATWVREPTRDQAVARWNKRNGETK